MKLQIQLFKDFSALKLSNNSIYWSIAMVLYIISYFVAVCNFSNTWMDPNSRHKDISDIRSVYTHMIQIIQFNNMTILECLLLFKSPLIIILLLNELKRNICILSPSLKNLQRLLYLEFQFL